MPHHNSSAIKGKVAGRQVRFLLLFFALFSVAMLVLATIAIASPSAEANTPQPPLELPATSEGAGVSVSGATVSADNAAFWIIGGKPDQTTSRIAARFGISQLSSGSGVYRVKRSDASAMAARLQRKGRLVYSEPDVQAITSGYPEDLYQSEEWWLNRIVNTTDTTPPEVTEFSPELALIEESVDPLHPDLLNARLAGSLSLGPDEDWHGTAIAAIAGSPGEGLGIRGVWPGMKMRLVPMGTTCSTASKAVVKAVKAGSKVLNMSYGFPSSSCFTHYVATEFAVKKGVLPVAAAGNTFGAGGNTAMRPATDPHVLSVSAVDANSEVAPFATQNPEVDITAPGVDVFAPTIGWAETTDGTSSIRRGWAEVSGTSFSTPMVAAAATWLFQSRPNLDARQIGRALTTSATDSGAPGRDPKFGEGILNIEAAQTVTAPARDRMEPNDDIDWLNGSILQKKSRFLSKPRAKKRKSVAGTLTRTKDAADVYRVKIRARSRVLITGAQYQGDIRLDVLKSKAKSISKPGKNLIVRSDRPRTKTEGVRVTNRKAKPQTVYVAITPSPRTYVEYSQYRLSVVR
ncbi:MAG: S8 family serine peptidase [Solirubrobacterales bacterium]